MINLFSMAISSATELESSLISFAGSDSTLTRQGVDKRKGKRPEGLWVGDYSREKIILKNFRLRRRLFEGQLLFEEIRYPLIFQLPVYKAPT